MNTRDAGAGKPPTPDTSGGEPNAVGKPHRLKVYDSSELFGSDVEIGIDHEGALYRMRITRQGKLILNK